MGLLLLLLIYFLPVLVLEQASSSLQVLPWSVIDVFLFLLHNSPPGDVPINYGERPLGDFSILIPKRVNL